MNPVSNKIYVTNSGSASVTVIDGATNVTTTVAAGTSPRARGGKPSDQQKIYVAIWVATNVTVIDGATMATNTVSAGDGSRYRGGEPGD